MKKSIKKMAVVFSMALALGGATVVATTATDVQAASKVKKIKFKKSSYNLQKGKKLKLSNQLVYTPSKVNTKKVTYKIYKSSVKSAATISSAGYVTAKKAATVYVKATSKSNKSKIAYTKVVIREAISSVKFNGASSATLAQGATKTISVKSNGWQQSVTSTTFKSNNTSVATVDSKGKITAKNPGVAKITVTRKGLYNSKSATYTVTVNKITKAGTYKNLTGALTISAPDKATVTLSNCKLSTLTLNNKANTVNADGCTITNVATSSAKSVSVDETHPVLQLGVKTIVTTINNKNPLSVVIGSSSVDLRKIKAESQLIVAQIAATDMPFALEIATSEKVEVAADIAKMEVTNAGANVVVKGNAWKVDVNTPSASSTKKPNIEVASTGSVQQIKVDDGTSAVAVTGSGNIDKVVVPDDAVTNGTLSSTITLPPTVDVYKESDAGKNEPTVVAPKKYVAATKESKDGITTMKVGVDSETYRVKKGTITSYVSKANIDKMINYFADPKAAYEAWTNGSTELPIDESGTVVIKTVNANTKVIAVTGTNTKDDVYTVTMNKESDTKYTVEVSNSKGEKHTATITANGTTAKLEGSHYIVDATATGFEVTKDGSKLLSVQKGDKEYTIEAQDSKVADVDIFYLVDNK